MIIFILESSTVWLSQIYTIVSKLVKVAVQQIVAWMLEKKNWNLGFWEFPKARSGCNLASKRETAGQIRQSHEKEIRLRIPSKTSSHRISGWRIWQLLFSIAHYYSCVQTMYPSGFFKTNTQRWYFPIHGTIFDFMEFCIWWTIVQKVVYSLQEKCHLKLVRGVLTPFTTWPEDVRL